MWNIKKWSVKAPFFSLSYLFYLCIDNRKTGTRKKKKEKRKKYKIIMQQKKTREKYYTFSRQKKRK